MNNFTQYSDDFNSYQKLIEPHSAQKSVIWDLAVNLVFDNRADFKGYAATIAYEHILDNIDIDKAQRAIESHYTNEQKAGAKVVFPALDIICVRAVKILSYKAFTLSPVVFDSMHHMLFENIEYMDSNRITDSFVKSNYQSVFIGADKIDTRLCSLIDNERALVIDKCTCDKCLEHLSLFACDLISIKAHDFSHRLSTIVFVIQYARSFGFNLQQKLSDTDNSVKTIMHSLYNHSEITSEQCFLQMYSFLSTLFLNKSTL